VAPDHAEFHPATVPHAGIRACGASAAIILDYFGDAISPREIKELSLHKSYSPEDPSTDFSITLFRELISGLAGRGYRWREKDYPDTARGLRQGLADIERSLDARIPVMIDTTVGEGHTRCNRGIFRAPAEVAGSGPQRSRSRHSRSGIRGTRPHLEFARRRQRCARRSLSKDYATFSAAARNSS
jgi:hypothetical protein